MYNFSFLKKDLLASLIVFLVALPLAIGISIACELSIYTGIISAIIGGVVVGAFSGSSLQVSGPAAGLILIVVELVRNYGADVLFAVVFLAGILQIVFGLFSLANWFRAITPAIILGMLSGIGISIFLSQFHYMLDSNASNTFLGNISDLFFIIKDSVLPLDGSVHHKACSVGILTILTIILWDKYAKGKYRNIPSALVAVVLASLYALVFHFDINYLKVEENFFSGATFLEFGNILSNLKNVDIIISVLIVTFIASAETLLTSNAVDKMSTSSKTDYNKEIIAQGIGNIICGSVGGLPITGVIVRSAANINAGAKTRASAVFHGIWILLFVLAFPFILNYIPMASLAAILVYTGYKLINVDGAKNLFKLSRGEFFVYAVTLVSILFTNLFEGIVIGFVVALFKNTFNILKSNFKVLEYKDRNLVQITLRGSITFLQLPTMIKIFEEIDPSKDVEIITKKLYFIDHAGIDFIHSWETNRNKGEAKTSINWGQIRITYPNFRWKRFNSQNVKSLH